MELFAFPLLFFFKYSLFIFNFAILIIVCPGFDFCELIFFGTLCVSLTWLSLSFPRLGKIFGSYGFM